MRKISFTGSTATGRKIMEASSGNLKRITLELGGNDPAIVLPDVDPKKLAKEIFWAAFQNSAQFCVAAKRVYVHESIYDDFAKELVEYAATITVGDGSQQGTDLGPIQNRMQYEKLQNLIADAKNKGLRFLSGGTFPADKGYFMPITIIDNPPEDSRVVVEEAFGPVLPLLKFKDIDDVVARANNTEYGIAASVWSNDVEKARSIAERMKPARSGSTRFHSVSPHVAFGGHKQSGVGMETPWRGCRIHKRADDRDEQRRLNCGKANPTPPEKFEPERAS